MNLRLLICGVLGGLLGTLTLSLPLYVVLPTRYSGDWIAPVPAPSWLGWAIVGYGLTVLVALVTGYAAARWGWAATTGARLKTGAQAGLLASLVAFPLIGASAAGVAGNDLLYRHGPVKAASEQKFSELVCDSVVGSTWMPYLTFWGMAAGGIVLGGLGGWLSRLGHAPRWGENPPAIAAEPIDAAIAILIGGSLLLVTVVAAIAMLRTAMPDSVMKLDAHPRFPLAGIKGWPVMMNLLFLVVASWFCGRWCWLRWDHALGGVRRVARTGAVILVVLPLITAALIASIGPDLFMELYFVLPASVWLGVTSFWACRLALGSRPASLADPPPLPSLRDRLLINAGLMGTLVPALVMLSGLAPIVTLALGLVPFVDVLATGPTGPERPPTVSHSMLNIYVIHPLASIYLTAVWIVGAALHAWVVFATQKGMALLRAPAVVKVHPGN